MGLRAFVPLLGNRHWLGDLGLQTHQPLRWGLTGPRSEPFPFAGSQSFFNFVGGVKAIADDGGAEILFIDRDGLQKDGGDGVRAIGDGLGGFRLAAPCENDSGIHGALGERAERLVNGHSLGAADDADDGGQVGVLAGDKDRAGELAFGESLNSAAGGSVVGGDDGGEIAVGFLESGEGGFVSLGFGPLGAPGFVGDGDLVGIGSLCEGELLAFLKLVGVVIELRALEKEKISGWRSGEHGGALEFASLDVIERDVERRRTVADEAVVADDGNILALGGLDHSSGFFGVVGNDNEDVDAGVEKLIGLLELEVVVALGIFDRDFGVDFVSAGLKKSGV